MLGTRLFKIIPSCCSEPLNEGFQIMTILYFFHIGWPPAMRENKELINRRRRRPHFSTDFSQIGWPPAMRKKRIKLIGAFGARKTPNASPKVYRGSRGTSL
jgi:hypothetical protein